MAHDNEVEVKETTISHPQEVVKTTTTTPPRVNTGHPQQIFNEKKTIFRTYQVIWYLLTVVEIVLGFRVAFKAFGANQMSGFTSLIYTLSDPLALPFSGILKNSIYGASLLEWSTIIAAIVYALIAYGLVHIMQIVKPVTQKEVEQKVDNAT
jgi:hypothetical protein